MSAGLRFAGWVPVSRLRAVHVGLGPIGLGVADAVARLPQVESVAAVDPLFAGRDLGELLAGPPSGVRVAADLDRALRDVPVDVALHCTGSHLVQVEPQLSALIGHGVNVVSTCEELAWPWFHHAREARRLDDQARAAGVRLLGTGVNPGFVMDLLPVFMGAVALRVDAVRVERVVDASTRRLPLQVKIGAGLTEEAFRERVEQRQLGHVGLVESVAMIAAGLGWELDVIEQVIEPVIAEQPIRSEALSVEAGQVRGLHQVATGSIGAERTISLDLVMILAAETPQDVIELTGLPTLRLRVEGGTHGDIATVAAVASAVPRIHRAPAGLVSVLDLPTAPTGRRPGG